MYLGELSTHGKVLRCRQACHGGTTQGSGGGAMNIGTGQIEMGKHMWERLGLVSICHLAFLVIPGN